jgi:phosphatidate cytidylyltransferase
LSSELTRRTLFGVVAAPIVVVIVFYGDAALAALLAVAAALAAWEFVRLARSSGLTPFDNASIVIAGLIPLAVHARYLRLYDPDGPIGVISIAILLLLALFAAAIWARGPQGKPLGAVAATVAAALYTGGTLSYAYAIRYHDYAFAPADVTLAGRTFSLPSGGLLLLLPLLLTWGNDIGGYAFGRAFGRHRLLPSVSPGKTVEGAVGGLLVSMLIAWAYGLWVLRPDTHLGFRAWPWGVLGFGALVSVAAQIGDLVESLLKRDAGVKDSSALIPGHGGVLDRVDSLLFALPVSFVVLGWLLTWAPS